MELADYRKEGISLISPSPNIRKSQYLAFQNSSGVDKSYKMDPNRFSPLKFQEKEDSDMSPIREVPRPMRNQEVFFADTSEFIPQRISTPDGTGEFVLNNS